jgi:hypothetical protein
MRPVSAAFTALLLAGMTLTSAQGAEGMWTLDQFPFEKAEKAYGFKPDQALLDQMRLSSLRIKGSCSASFVSPHGLVQTNHHCVTSCIKARSTQAQDLMVSGFYANEAKDELKCSGLELDQLIAITDVTERLNGAGAAKDETETRDAVASEKKAIIEECAQGDAATRCEVVELHGGGVRNVYKFRTYRDVRLVLAPERAMASFGGELDNFEFPRFAFDVAYLRIYVDDKPLDSSTHCLRYAKTDAQPGDITFVPGSPGWTDRLLTVAQLEFRRDVELPQLIFYNAELRGVLSEYSARGAKQMRAASALLSSIDSALRNDKRRQAALADPAIIKARTQVEKTVRTTVNLDPDLQAKYGDAWDKIAEMVDDFRGWRDYYMFTAGGQGFRSQLFRFAQTLIRYPGETAKPDDERLNAFSSRNLDSTLRSVTARTTIDLDFEKLTLAFSLTAMRDALGAHDPFVKLVLGTKSPRQRAAELIDSTSLGNAETRTRLVEGGAATISGSNDPMIVLARAVDPHWRALQTRHEEEVEAIRNEKGPLVARAIFDVLGHSVYPDATYTPRVSFGAVRGYRVAGRDIDPITTIGGLFEHATGTVPYKLPERWLAARGALNLAQPLNFTTTNDLIGGFSGSAAVNKEGEVVGVMFDINAQALGGYFGYNPQVNRAIALNVGALREVLSKIVRADRIIEELTK